MTVQTLGVREPDDFDTAFAAMTPEMPDGIFMVTDALTALNRKRVFEFAAAHLVPAIYEYEFLARDGGLTAYGPDGKEGGERVADLVDRILKGAKPADLPFEQPTRFRFVINLERCAASPIKKRRPSASRRAIRLCMTKFEAHRRSVTPALTPIRRLRSALTWASSGVSFWSMSSGSGSRSTKVIQWFSGRGASRTKPSLAREYHRLLGLVRQARADVGCDIAAGVGVSAQGVVH